MSHMGECTCTRSSTMSMVTQRSVQHYARGSFLFTAFLEIAISTRRVYCQCKVGDILSSLLAQKLLYVNRFLQVCLASGQ